MAPVANNCMMINEVVMEIMVKLTSHWARNKQSPTGDETYKVMHIFGEGDVYFAPM
jgi:hypothetical protein